MQTLISVIIAFTMGNFIAQYFHDVPDYMLATERSFFQFIALSWYYIVMRIEGRINDVHETHQG